MYVYKYECYISATLIFILAWMSCTGMYYLLKGYIGTTRYRCGGYIYIGTTRYRCGWLPWYHAVPMWRATSVPHGTDVDGYIGTTQYRCGGLHRYHAVPMWRVTSVPRSTDVGVTSVPSGTDVGAGRYRCARSETATMEKVTTRSRKLWRVMTGNKRVTKAKPSAPNQNSPLCH